MFLRVVIWGKDSYLFILKNKNKSQFPCLRYWNRKYLVFISLFPIDTNWRTGSMFMCFPSHLTTALTLKQNAGVLLFALGGEILTGTCSEPGSKQNRKVVPLSLSPSVPRLHHWGPFSLTRPPGFHELRTALGGPQAHVSWYTHRKETSPSADCLPKWVCLQNHSFWEP